MWSRSAPREDHEIERQHQREAAASSARPDARDHPLAEGGVDDQQDRAAIDDRRSICGGAISHSADQRPAQLARPRRAAAICAAMSSSALRLRARRPCEVSSSATRAGVSDDAEQVRDRGAAQRRRHIATRDRGEGDRRLHRGRQQAEVDKAEREVRRQPRPRRGGCGEADQRKQDEGRGEHQRLQAPVHQAPTTAAATAARRRGRTRARRRRRRRNAQPPRPGRAPGKARRARPRRPAQRDRGRRPCERAAPGRPSCIPRFFWPRRAAPRVGTAQAAQDQPPRESRAWRGSCPRRRQADGGAPTIFLNARLKAASDP